MKVPLIAAVTIALSTSFSQAGSPFIRKLSSALVMSSATTSSTSAKLAPISKMARDYIRKTPLLHSPALSQLTANNNPVYFKLDALQPSGSFKDRGMAHLCTTYFEHQGITKFISSSGGNAGLAVSTVPFTDVNVVVPETTKPLVIQKLASLGANVTVFGENWNAADKVAREMVQEGSIYVSPYDDPLLWTGHSSVVDEIIEQLDEDLGAIIVSVGGGGLLCGVLEGLERHQKTDCHVIAAETKGAASFAASWINGKEIVTLPGITSVATSLGATSVTPAVIERGLKHVSAGGKLDSAVMEDVDAVYGCSEFAKEMKMLVEPACGAALAVLYSDALRKEYLKDVPKGKAIVIEVCGGSGVNVEMLQQWKEEFLS